MKASEWGSSARLAMAAAIGVGFGLAIAAGSAAGIMPRVDPVAGWLIALSAACLAIAFRLREASSAGGAAIDDAEASAQAGSHDEGWALTLFSSHAAIGVGGVDPGLLRSRASPSEGALALDATGSTVR